MRIGCLIVFGALVSGCVDPNGLVYLDGGSDSGVIPGHDAGAPDAGGVDAGAPDAGDTDGGNPDAGDPDAGAPDAGEPDAGTVDAGASCPGSPRKLLRCDPPIVLDGGALTIYSGALAAHPQGFLAGVVQDLVIVNQVNFDAGVSFVFSRQKLDGGAYGPGAQLDLESSGAAWVATWLQPSEDHAVCMTSRDGSTNAVRVMNGGNMSMIDAALSADGGQIALASQRQSIGAPFLGAEGGACPAQLSALAFPSSTFGASVVWTNSGFRYVYSGLAGQPIGSGTGRILIGTLTDAGWPGSLSNTGQPGRNHAAASLAGDNVLVTYASDAGSLNQASVLVSPANGPVGTAVPLSSEPGSSVIGACGPNCAVAGVVPRQPSQPVTLSFFTEAPLPTSRGSWDLTCDATGTSTLSLAMSGGRLGALVTGPSGAKLYVCDLPGAGSD